MQNSSHITCNQQMNAGWEGAGTSGLSSPPSLLLLLPLAPLKAEGKGAGGEGLEEKLEDVEHEIVFCNVYVCVHTHMRVKTHPMFGKTFVKWVCKNKPKYAQKNSRNSPKFSSSTVISTAHSLPPHLSPVGQTDSIFPGTF